MTCQDTNNISIRFPRIGLEIQPYTVDFRIDRTQLDYLDAKFSEEVGEYLKPYTEREDAALRKPQPAEVVMDGEVSHTLYFRPSYVTYGETNCWVELHDAQKHLQHTVVDDKFERVTAKNAYRRLFEKANTNDVLSGIEFAIPDTARSNLPEGIPKGPGGVPLIPTTGTDPTIGLDYIDKFSSLWRDYDEAGVSSGDDGQNILDSQYNFDLKNQNTLKAIYTLNDELGLQSWVNDKGVLIVGLDFMEASHHVASANDSRVWRYHDAEITPPGSPIKMAVVNGGTIDAPNSTQEEDAVESVLEFLNPVDDHEEDLIAQGVAQRPGIVNGKIVSIDEPNLARDSLEARAYQVLANEMTNNNSGSVEINPETSGTEISNWRNVEVGDFLQLIPADGEDCKDVERDVMLISGVKHKVDGGSWDIHLNIQKWANPETETTLRYFSPDSDNYYNEDFEEIYTDNGR